MCNRDPGFVAVRVRQNDTRPIRSLLQNGSEDRVQFGIDENDGFAMLKCIEHNLCCGID